jgi:hypothetical protein
VHRRVFHRSLSVIRQPLSVNRWLPSVNGQLLSIGSQYQNHKSRRSLIFNDPPPGFSGRLTLLLRIK